MLRWMAELHEAHFKTNVNKQISTATKHSEDDQKYLNFLDLVKSVMRRIRDSIKSQFSPFQKSRFHSLDEF